MAQQVKTTLDFVNEGRIINLPNGVNPQDAITLSQAQAMVEGLNWKDDCRVATTANINLSSPGATIDGIAMAANDRVLVKDQTTTTQNGIYIWNGAAVAMTRALDASTFDELEGAKIRVTEGTVNNNTDWNQTQVNGVIGTNNIVFASANSSTPPASESIAGIAEIATQAETDAGTDDARIVTPLKLKTSTILAKMASALIGDGSATQYDITHGFNTRKVLITVRRNSSPWDEVIVDKECPDANTARVRFSVAPTSNSYQVSIIAIP
jgi:hypothetical protein